MSRFGVLQNAYKTVEHKLSAAEQELAALRKKERYFTHALCGVAYHPFIGLFVCLFHSRFLLGNKHLADSLVKIKHLLRSFSLSFFSPLCCALIH
jgi:hypothetical protein